MSGGAPWRMGGDRDGNPFVTATCTRDVTYLARITAVNLYFSAIQNILFSLSMWRCTDKLKVRVAGIVKAHDADTVYEERRRQGPAPGASPTLPKTSVIIRACDPRFLGPWGLTYNPRHVITRVLDPRFLS